MEDYCRHHCGGCEPQRAISGSSEHHFLQPVVPDGWIRHAQASHPWMDDLAILDQSCIVHHLWSGRDPTGRYLLLPTCRCDSASFSSRDWAEGF